MSLSMKPEGSFTNGPSIQPTDEGRMMKNAINIMSGTVSVFCLIYSAASFAQSNLPYYLQDRGTGIPTSMFGTFISDGQTIVYPFVEYYSNKDAEYKPSELGYGNDTDYRAKYEAKEALIFVSHAFSDMVAAEFEIAAITATQHKASNDTSSMPDKIEESGLGDVEGQIRWRYNKESENTPEYFSYFETVLPLQKDKKIIGTQDWEFKLGVGALKGYTWGTIMARAAVEYDRTEKKTELGEMAVEYLKRVSTLFRYNLAIEGAQDEWDFIVDLQYHFRENAFIRFNSGFGLTSKSDDFTPEIGVVFYF